LGLVLASLAENRLFLATGNYGLSWLWRPGVLVFFAVLLASLVYPFLKKAWQRCDQEPQLATPRAVHQPERGSIRLS
jgi:hypothetical protein